MMVNNPYRVKILRGIPGAGKTRLRSTVFAKAFSVSADEFFMNQGRYEFDPEKLALAHGQCLRQFIALVQRLPRPRLIVVDNTSLEATDIAPYVEVARAYGYDAEVITLWCDPVVAAKRNVHCVPVEQVKQKADFLLQHLYDLPSWWPHSIVLVDAA